MGSLTIGWTYLTGYAIATDPASRDRVEWPPHPARIFMALAAAWFETRPPAGDADGIAEWEAEGDALRWLESKPDPDLIVPEVDATAVRSEVTVYVPVNDRAGPSSATIQSAPGITRSKQPRSFPKVWVGDATAMLHWPRLNDVEVHHGSLDRLCRKVTRIGHSSALVAMRTVGDFDRSGALHLVPDADALARYQLRPVTKGMLSMLTERFGGEVRAAADELDARIAAKKQERKTVAGKNKRERGAEIDAEITGLMSERALIVPRPPVRPAIGVWTAYRLAEKEPPPDAARTHFDHDLLVLTNVAGRSLPVSASLAITRALRNVILRDAPQPPPDWVSGHASDGGPLLADEGHLAIVPLPHVGHEHADGRLMGLGLIFPRSLDYRERGRVLGPVLVDKDGRPRNLELTLGRLGTWTIRKRDWQETRRALDPGTWSAFVDVAKQGARTWASVTPVVLDKYPKADRSKPAERQAWEEEVEAIIRVACGRIDLPDPEIVDFGTTCWHIGSPRAVGKRRHVRGGSDRADAPLGDGFPSYPRRGESGSRPQVHVWLRFSQPVVGPVLLGSGRYFGYGLCKPLENHRRV
jgi:CRISPR-associated protein Csb2